MRLIIFPTMAADSAAAGSRMAFNCRWIGCTRGFENLDELVVHLDEAHVSSSAVAAAAASQQGQHSGTVAAPGAATDGRSVALTTTASALHDRRMLTALHAFFAVPESCAVSGRAAGGTRRTPSGPSWCSTCALTPVKR